MKRIYRVITQFHRHGYAFQSGDYVGWHGRPTKHIDNAAIFHHNYGDRWLIRGCEAIRFRIIPWVSQSPKAKAKTSRRKPFGITK